MSLVYYCINYMYKDLNIAKRLALHSAHVTYRVISCLGMRSQKLFPIKSGQSVSVKKYLAVVITVPAPLLAWLCNVVVHEPGCAKGCYVFCHGLLTVSRFEPYTSFESLISI
jgi:hypothetical protein